MAWWREKTSAMGMKPYWRLIRHEYASANISSLRLQSLMELYSQFFSFSSPFTLEEATPSTLSKSKNVHRSPANKKKRVKHEARLIVLLRLFFSSFSCALHLQFCLHSQFFDRRLHLTHLCADLAIKSLHKV
jgi:hypothetical protein